MTINTIALKMARNITFAAYLQRAKLSAPISLSQFKERKKQKERATRLLQNTHKILFLHQARPLFYRPIIFIVLDKKCGEVHIIVTPLMCD